MNLKNNTSTYTVPVPPGKAGTRLDRLLAETLPDMSRTRLKALIDGGSVHLKSSKPAAAALDPSRKVRSGEVFIVVVPPALPAKPAAQDIDLEILYEDDDVIVLDKPVGLVVHPAPGNPDKTLVNALLGHAAKAGNGGGLSGIGGVERPGIVHRLDKGTSGLMIVAKNDRSHHSLSTQFSERTIERAYKALVWGVPSQSSGDIEGNIGRNPRNRKKMAVVGRGGKFALTRYRVLESFGTKASLVECRLATGRTHQIRVHMAHLGHPVMGDPLYGRVGTARLNSLEGEAKALVHALDHQALHAYILGYRPLDGKDINRFESDLPNNINEILKKMRGE